MIHVKDNQCPICLTDNLCCNLDIQKSDMQMFKCGHGTCKSCYTKWKTSKTEFTCPTCREIGQSYSNGFGLESSEKWDTFAEWYNHWEVFIKAGSANNIIKHSSFGKQLLRLVKETKQANLKKLQLKEPKEPKELKGQGPKTKKTKLKQKF
jgi:hypothetical protein